MAYLEDAICKKFYPSILIGAWFIYCKLNQMKFKKPLFGKYVGTSNMVVIQIWPFLYSAIKMSELSKCQRKKNVKVEIEVVPEE